MGLTITGSITTKDGESFDNCYARIDQYGLVKSLGYVTTFVGFYKSREDAEPAFPTYQEDYQDVDNSGAIYDLKIGPGDDDIFPTYIEFPLTQSEQVTVTTYSSSFEDQTIDYIDYDDDGNEITSQRTQRVALLHSGSKEVTKSRINMNLITGSTYEYAYAQFKQALIENFPSCTINDDV